MFFTKKGDSGTTTTFACNQRISKSSAITEALGAIDETNSFLGLCKIKSLESGFLLGDQSFADIVLNVQQTLFTISAELAGADKKIDEEKVHELEFLTETVEKILPPIKTFFISGATELGSLFDIARTIARRAERRVVAVRSGADVVLRLWPFPADVASARNTVSPQTLAYMNRLSSLLYALARLTSHLSGINEESPNYK